MPRTCTICHDSDRDAVEAAIVRGEPYRGIAARWGLSDSAVARHAANHLAEALRLAREVRTLASGLAAAELLDAAATKAAERLLLASPGRDTDAAIATACRVVEARARLESGHVSQAPAVEVNTLTIEAMLADPELAARLSDQAVELEMAGSGSRALEPLQPARLQGTS